MGIPLPPTTASVLQARCIGTVDNILTSHTEDAEIRIYTDGGATRGATKKAAWGAAAFLFFLSGCFQLIGVINGGVQISRTSGDFLGATHLTNNTAELTAVTWMLTWLACMVCDGLTLPVTILPDSTYAVNTIKGDTVAHANRELAEHGRALLWGLSHKLKVEFQVVKGHSGDPFNDLADTLATVAMEGTCVPETRPSVTASFLKELTVAYNLRCQYSHESQGEPTIAWPVRFSTVARPLATSFAPRSDVSLDFSELWMVTANVLTLSPAESRLEALGGGLRQAGRVADVAEQLQKAGIHLAGLQETRLPSAQPAMSSHYIMIGSAADSGKCGCSLWIAKSMKVTLKHLNVVCSEPRILAVNITSPSIKCQCVVAHSPVEGDPAGVHFWHSLAVVLRGNRSKKGPIFVFVDANATIGSLCSDAVGNTDPDGENQNGHALHSVLAEFGLAAASTFVNNTGSRSGTWVPASSSGTPKARRIDYICIPQWAIRHIGTSGVQHDIDISIKRDDHYPVVLSLDVRAIAKDAERPLVTRRVPLCDKAKIADPSCIKHFQVLLERIPFVPTQVDVDTHHATIITHIAMAARQAFPLSAVRPSKPWIGAEAWTAIRHHRQLSRAAKDLGIELKVIIQKAYFAAWLTVTRQQPYETNFVTIVGELSLTRQAYAWALRLAGVQHRALKRLVRADARAFAHTIAIDASVAAKHGDNKGFYKAIRRLRKSPSSPMGPLLLEDGTPAPSTLARQGRWQRHFASELEGTIMDVEGLIKVARQHHETRPPPQPLTAPTPQELQAIISATKPGKAAGEDLLPPAIAKAAPWQLTQLLWPLVNKACTLVQVPLAWKGGPMANIWKGKDHVKHCQSSRGVLVADWSAKLIPKQLRGSMTHVLDFLHNGQCGGRRHRSIDFVAHTSQAFFSRARTRRKPAAVIFMDVISAFYSMLREILFGWNGTDEELIARLAGHGVTDISIHQIMNYLASERSVLSEAGATPAEHAMIEELHSGAWFSIENVETLVTTTKGALPGHPMADLVFEVTYTRAIKDAQKDLTDQNIITTIPLARDAPCIATLANQNEDIKVDDVTFVDDEAAFVNADTPQQLIENAITTVAAYKHHLAKYGLWLNFKPGKTEAVIFWTGQGCRTIRNSLKSDDGHVITIDTDTKLRIVQNYKHTGTIVTATGSMLPEAKARAASAMNAYRPLAGPFFGSSAIPSKDKWTAMGALVMSRLLLSAHTWVKPSPSAVEQLDRCQLTILRRVSGDWRKEGGLTDRQVYETTGKPTAEALLRQSRLRYLPRLLAHAPDLLRALLQSATDAPTEWAAMARTDLMHMWWTCPKLALLPSPCIHLQAWCDLCIEWPNMWAKYVSKWGGLPLHPKAEDWKGDDSTQVHALAQACTEWPCYECGKSFPVRRDLTTHAARVHGYTRLARVYVASEQCPFCLKSFGSRLRAIHHIHYWSRRCLNLMAMGTVPQLPPEVVQKLDSDDCVLRRAHCKAGTSYTTWAA